MEDRECKQKTVMEASRRLFDLYDLDDDPLLSIEEGFDIDMEKWTILKEHPTLIPIYVNRPCGLCRWDYQFLKERSICDHCIFSVMDGEGTPCLSGKNGIENIMRDPTAKRIEKFIYWMQECMESERENEKRK